MRMPRSASRLVETFAALRVPSASAVRCKSAAATGPLPAPAAAESPRSPRLRLLPDDERFPVLEGY